jgi:hypothetical protein
MSRRRIGCCEHTKDESFLINRVATVNCDGTLLNESTERSGGNRQNWTKYRILLYEKLMIVDWSVGCSYGLKIVLISSFYT